MGLVNSDGNYLEVEQVNTHNVLVSIYESKAIYDNGLKANFETRVSHHLHCGVDLENHLHDTTASGTGGRSRFTNMVLSAEEVIVAQATENDARHTYGSVESNNYIKGDWAVWVAA